MSHGSQRSPSIFPRRLQKAKHVVGRHWFGTYHNVVVCYWMDTCTPDELRSLSAVYRAVASEYKTKVSSIHYVAQSAELPLPDLRKDFVASTNPDLERLGCVGVVLAGAGFWVSALSGFIIGVRMLLPKSLLSFRVARDLEELKPWFLAEPERTTGTRLDDLPLAAWIEQARAGCASSEG